MGVMLCIILHSKLLCWILLRFPLTIFGQPFGKRFALCYWTVVLSCLSVCDVGVLWQMVGRIKMKLGMQVGLGPSHTVLDEDPAPPPQRSTAPNLRPMSVVTKRLDGLRRHLVWR